MTSPHQDIFTHISTILLLALSTQLSSSFMVSLPLHMTGGIKSAISDPRDMEFLLLIY